MMMSACTSRGFSVRYCNDLADNPSDYCELTRIDLKTMNDSELRKIKK